MPDIQTMDRLIAEEVRVEMSRQRIKQTEIARNVFGKRPQWFQVRVSGEVPMTSAELLKVADYLGVSVVKFLSAVHPIEPGSESAGRAAPPSPAPRRRNNRCYSAPGLIIGPWGESSVQRTDHAA